jgi:hypothetical protein
LGVGHKADDLALEKISIVKFKIVKPGWSNSQEWTNMAEFSEEGYGSKRAILLTMLMIILTESKFKLFRIALFYSSHK